ncbi:MAG: hypothetical protein K1W22_06610 [Lachnospiraceae bacterium]
MRDPASYHSIISAIAGGAGKLNEISVKTGLESSACSNFMTSLMQIGIMEKERPVTEKENSRKTIYHLQDSMFLFFGYWKQKRWRRNFSKSGVDASTDSLAEQYGVSRITFEEMLGTLVLRNCPAIFAIL